jgi:hypothetical protein
MLLGERIQSDIHAPLGSEKFGGVSKMTEAVQRVAANMVKLRDVDSALATKLQPDVDTWIENGRKFAEAEQACLASPKCQEGRAAKPVCEAIELRNSLAVDMAKEKSNPSGYVNASYLNKLGRAIQDADTDIQERKQDFATAKKKPFSAAMCKP